MNIESTLFAHNIELKYTFYRSLVFYKEWLYYINDFKTYKSKNLFAIIIW